ncbi:MAG: lysylphosphatidylglycerol synthase transmembrane domain-containing protein, partial [Planctomycetota bacterium]
MNPTSNDSRNSSAGGSPRLSGPVRTVLLILLSIAILIAVVAVVGFNETLEGLERAGLTAFLALGAIQVVVVTLQTVAWGILNRPVGHRVGARTLFEANLVGYAVNVITPSAYLGGEPAKVVYVGRKTGLSYTGLAGTVVLAKYMEAISFFLFFTTATIVALVIFRDEIFSSQYLPVGLVLSVLGTVLLVVCIALWLSLVRQRHPLTRLVALVSLVRPKSRFFARLRNRTRRMEDQVNQVFCEHGRSAFRSFAVFLVVHAVIFVRPAFFILITDGV